MIIVPELRIEVERSRHEAVEFSFEITPAALELVDDPEFHFSAPVRGHIHARMIGGETIHVRGEITTAAQSECVRCLQDLRVMVTAEFDLMFLPEPSASEKSRFARLEEDEKMYYSGDFLHPGEALREELMINLPFVPACELGPGDICPVRGEKVVFEIPGSTKETPSKPEPKKIPETGNSLAAQLERVRKQMKKE